MELVEKIKRYELEGVIPSKISSILIEFIDNYLKETQYSPLSEKILNQLVHLSLEQIAQPFTFSSYHEAVRAPVDYLRFGIHLIEPLIQKKLSSVNGLALIDDMIAFQAKGGNTILFGNHQTEPDPQIIISLLSDTHQAFAENIIFVAGNRVTTDPLAIPFSLGVNLLCIYSKRYIETPPEHKHEKLAHNQHVMYEMKKLLSEGGKCIYVAPSGGRDRPNQDGHMTIPPFEPSSIEMFRLMAQASKQPTRFHPLALWTYPLMPPPPSIKKELLEPRTVKSTPIHLAFGDSIDLNAVLAECPLLNKHEKRNHLAATVWEHVNTLYEQLLKTRNLS